MVEVLCSVNGASEGSGGGGGGAMFTSGSVLVNG